MATSDPPPPERLQTPVPCDGCDTGDPGKHYCTICRKTMCNNCHTIHAKLLQNHKVVPRAKLMSCANTASANLSENENVKSEIDKIKTEIQRAHADIMQNLKESEKQNLVRATEDHSDNENIKMELDTIKAEMQRDHADIMQTLKQLEKQYIEKSFNDIRNKFQELKRAGKNVILVLITLLCFIGYLQFQGSYEKPAVTGEMSLVIEEFSQEVFKQVESLKHDLSRKSVYLRRPFLKLSTPEILASFQAEIQGIPSICTTSDGHTWIGGYESRELILVDINGKIHNRRKVQHRTRHLAMMASGDIIIIPLHKDSSSVIRLGNDGTETFIYEASPSVCNGVSVASDERILICTNSASKGTVLACDSNCSIVQEIYKKDKRDSTVHAIELPDKTICISDPSSNRLVVIDKDGQLITTITQPLGRTNYWPFGLACDRMGNILSADGSNDCVYIIDQNRQVKELVGSSHGIKTPRWVDIDKDDNLWIAQDDGTITVVKYLT